MAQVYAQLPADTRLRTAVELEASIDGILSRHVRDSAVHVFGYGSLMWNPAVEHVGVCPEQSMLGTVPFACDRSSGAGRKSAPD